ncbi:MAG TPA: hypothetical protein VKZ53_24670 [Candidatus Angelobacter sp.]|nr:hypothetical protein [Candidatus Angelobacter sp.]
MIRRAVTAFLATVGSRTRIYLPTIDIVERARSLSTNKGMVVLCAGSGGGILDMVNTLSPGAKIMLTDLVPDLRFTGDSSAVTYDPRPIDARHIPADLKGARILFGSFHHFRPDDAKAILESAVHANEPIAVFEGTERSVRGIAVCFLIPILVLFMMPLIRPVRIAWLVLTYLIPILPVIIFWDGLVSSLRSYTQLEMRALVEALTSYEWEVGVLSGPHHERISYLFGTGRHR